ncbi:cobalamin B12-binding domain-containing protein [Nocardiopsis lambiniae]|uniref:Cobalamin-dependent protein n=1 Tax=Nocardiopsis lambiniae TaxID=3075539 RepID=A0ABU2M5Z4_9ACTN|nr:cobalamin-dependent protein [Nocardiopsis sp. DSM 44743]MDT0328083.1 cobalamin-dependent protein [Nocardiopsis sp. DSM 44743]
MRPISHGPAPEDPGPVTVLSGTSSDSHTWNLVFLQLLLEEAGHRVVNLGPCVPDDLLIDRVREHRPRLLVVSSVNGHGYEDGLRAVTALRAAPGTDGVTAVIGGKLGVDGVLDRDRVDALATAGFDAVFADGDTDAFRVYLGGFVLEAAS